VVTAQATAVVRIPNGIVTASLDGTIRVLTCRPNTSGLDRWRDLACEHVFRAGAGIWCLSYIPVLHCVAAAASNGKGTITVWSLDPHIRSCVRVLDGHMDDVYDIVTELRVNGKPVPVPSGRSVDERAAGEWLELSRSLKHSAPGAQSVSLTIVSGSADQSVKIWTLQPANLSA